MSNPFDGKFASRFAGIQTEYANDLVRVLGVPSMLAEKMASDIAADFGRLENADVKGVKIGKAKKENRMMDVKISLGALKTVETERLYCYRVLQELRAVQLETGIKMSGVELPEKRAKAIAEMHQAMIEAEKSGKGWINPCIADAVKKGLEVEARKLADMAS